MDALKQLFSTPVKTTMMVLALIGVVPSCTEKKVEMTLRVTVKTNQKDAVAGAVVKVDGAVIGESDAKGELVAKLPLPAQSRRKLEVSKQSDNYYFAPYFESIVVGDSPQELALAATLFFVPKPGSEGTEASEGAELAKAAEKADPQSGTSQTAEAANVQKEAQVVRDEPSTAVVTDVASTTGAVDNASAAAATGADGPYPKPIRPTRGALVFTVHVYDAGTKGTGVEEKPLQDAFVFLGTESSGDLKLGCKTNVRGRCVVRFPAQTESLQAGQPVTFVAKKSGYLTRGEQVEVVDDGSVRLSLSRGETIDIFATTRTYNFLKGLPGVEVTIKGKPAGVTDAFGRFSYGFVGKHNDLLSVALKSHDFLPENFETDFVVSGPMTLVRYFAPREAPPVKVTLLKAQPGSNLSPKELSAFDGSVDLAIYAAAKTHMFSGGAFSEYPAADFARSLRLADLTMGQAVKKGWNQTDLKAVVDAAILPSISIQQDSQNPLMELSLIDSKGMVLAAAREKLDSLKDEAAIRRSMEVLAAKIIRAFPFEGAVIGKEAKHVTINIGRVSGRGLSVGDLAEIHGIQGDAKGKNQIQRSIGLVRITEVFDESARGEIRKIEPRAVISRGDLIVLRPRTGAAPLASAVRVMSGGGAGAGAGSKPVPQANVYLDERWAGATDDNGRMTLDPSQAKGIARVTVTKLGYKQFTADVNFTKPKKLDVILKRDTAYVRIDSRPQGATVTIEGVGVGKTPLASPVVTTSGFSKLQVEGPAPYKKYEAVLELDEGTIDLTGPNAIMLEVDFVAQARVLASTKPEQALAKLAEIPAEHSDYLMGKHFAGEIYLSKTKSPPKAAEAFAEVTRSPAVATFADKRFIGSHVNEGIALFLVAEDLREKNVETARAHYIKAAEVLDRAVPHMRFVPPAEHDQAVHNVDYYRALARHRLWSMSKDQGALAEAYRAWRDYVEGSAKSVPLNQATKPLAENARVYYRLVQSSMLSTQQQ